jgi:hypothetical protein
MEIHVSTIVDAARATHVSIVNDAKVVSFSNCLQSRAQAMSTAESLPLFVWQVAHIFNFLFFFITRTKNLKKGLKTQNMDLHGATY